MKIGIVETESDVFMKDVRSRLDGIPTEFFSMGQDSVKPRREYRLIIDRLSHLDKSLNEYLRFLKDTGIRIINDPFIWSDSNKLIEIGIFDKLGINHPKTFFLPSEEVEWDLGASLPPIDWEKLATQMHFPGVLKPIDSFGWYKVFEVTDMDAVRQLYDALNQQNVLILQEKVIFKDYYRVFCINKKDVQLVKWKPASHFRGVCMLSDHKEIEHHKSFIEEKTIAFNKKIGADVNVMEWAIDMEDRPVAIEAYNFTPDIEPSAMPREYYDWIVEKFSGMIREKWEQP